MYLCCPSIVSYMNICTIYVLCCRLLVGEDRCAQGGLSGSGVPAAGPHPERSLGQHRGLGLHHPAARGLSRGTDPVCPAAAGRWSAGTSRGTDRVHLKQIERLGKDVESMFPGLFDKLSDLWKYFAVLLFFYMYNHMPLWCMSGGCEECRRQHPSVWRLFSWKFGLRQSLAGAWGHGQPGSHLLHGLTSQRGLRGRWAVSCLFSFCGIKLMWMRQPWLPHCCLCLR